MIPRPKNKLIAWLSEPYGYEVAVAFFLVFGGAANSIRAFNADLSTLIGSLWAFSASGVFIVSVMKALVLSRVNAERKTTHELDGCLHVLHSYLKSTATEKCRVRAVIHVPDDSGQEIQQVTEYVGDKYSAGKVGRKFPVQSGIVGRAYRTREPIVAVKQSSDRDEFLQELISEWGYSERDALEADPYSQTWMAVPIAKAGDGPVFGVLFVDATDPEFFTAERQEFVFFATSGIVEYVVRRYKA